MLATSCINEKHRWFSERLNISLSKSIHSITCFKQRKETSEGKATQASPSDEDDGNEHEKEYNPKKAPSELQERSRTAPRDVKDNPRRSPRDAQEKSKRDPREAQGRYKRYPRQAQ